jgi:hypothetical protein
MCAAGMGVRWLARPKPRRSCAAARCTPRRPNRSGEMYSAAALERCPSPPRRNSLARVPLFPRWWSRSESAMLRTKPLGGRRELAERKSSRSDQVFRLVLSCFLWHVIRGGIWMDDLIHCDCSHGMSSHTEYGCQSRRMSRCSCRLNNRDVLERALVMAQAEAHAESRTPRRASPRCFPSIANAI